MSIATASPGQLVRIGVSGGGWAEFTTIQAAINFAAASTPAPSATAPYTVEIFPGIYNEAITMSTCVNLKGVGPKGSVIIYQNDADIMVLANPCQVENLTIRLGTPSVTRYLAKDNAVACTVRFTNVVFEIVTPGIVACVNIELSGASNLIVESCSYNIAGTGGGVGINNAAGAGATVRITNCDFAFNQIGPGHLRSTVASTWTMEGNIFTGNLLVTCNLGTFRFTNDALNCNTMIITAGSVTVKSGPQQYEVYDDMLIQHAITAAAADTPAPSATAPYTILIHPGYYNEVITGSTWINLKGIGPKGSVIVYNNVATLYPATNTQYENMTFRLDSPGAAREIVRGTGTFRMTNCVFEVVNPGAWGHIYFYLVVACSMTLERCSANITSTSCIFIQSQIAASTIHLVDNDFTLNDATGTMVWSNIPGTTITGGGNRWAGTCAMFSVVANTTILLNGDTMTCTGTSNVAAGSVCLKNGQQQYEVWPGMRIQHAITAAAADTPAPSATAPYTVLIHPGVYAEVVTCSAYVHLKGVAKDTVIIQQTDADAVILASNVEIGNLTVRITTPLAQRSLLKDNAAALTGVKLSNVVLAYTTPAAIANLGVLLTGGSTVTMERCSADWAVPGTGAEIVVSVTTAASTVLLDNCNFRNTNVTAGSLINSAFAGTTITVVNSRLGGTVSHLVASAGVIRVSNSQYRSVARTGTGNIVDESPSLLDSIYHLMKKVWEVLTAAVYNSRTVAGGVITLGGAGQVRLRITNVTADVAALESAADAAGSLESSFTPARTPRYIQQISVSAFSAGADGNRMFFGLRETLSGVIPDITAEECAGFDWNGTNFRAISSDGGGAGVATVLATPSTGAQHQLEVIVFGGVKCEFYVDGVLVATHSTAAGIPAVALDWQELIHGAGTGASSAGDVTLRRGGVQECSS